MKTSLYWWQIQYFICGVKIFITVIFEEIMLAAGENFYIFDVYKLHHKWKFWNKGGGKIFWK